MSYAEKMDVLDFIIETLKEHEKALDELTHRLETCLGGAPKGKLSISRSGVVAHPENWR